MQKNNTGFITQTKIPSVTMLLLIFFLGTVIPCFGENMTLENSRDKKIEALEDAVKKLTREIERLKKTTQPENTASSIKGPCKKTETHADLWDRLSVSGLVEIGAVYDADEYRDNTDADVNDISLTTVELDIGLAINDWVNIETVLLYEDPTGNSPGDESDITLDVAILTMGNTEKCPFYLAGGKFFVPFGAVLTHFPDDPLVDQPMTLAFGEINEKAILLGYEKFDFSLSGYVFNGETYESASDDSVEQFGFDINYTLPCNDRMKLFTGLSYISNIAEGLGKVLHDSMVKNYVGGCAAYLQMGFKDLFFEAEYMTALKNFAAGELGGTAKDKPSVWNMETGFNYDWGKNLEIALKYSGSNDTGNLGYAKKRVGICFNQEIFKNIVGSLAYYRDKFHTDDMDGRIRRDVVLGQIAVSF